MIVATDGGRPIKMWVVPRNTPETHYADIEPQALAQLVNISKLPFVHKNGVAAMPDVHLGIGATVGSVIATQGAIIPAAVGVDIGCGMEAVRTSLHASDLPDSLAKLRHSIERGVPLGTGGRQNAQGPALDGLFALIPKFPSEDFVHKFVSDVDNVARQIGTLGSGNHFIEVCLDEAQRVWVMLHSGSRGIGNRIGTHYIAEAKRKMEEYFITLPDTDLAYFPDGTPEFAEYTAAVGWAQDFARTNRQWMMASVLKSMTHELDVPFAVGNYAISCHHNYVEKENHFGQNLWVTRKGAIRARAGDFGIIPGSMGTRSYIVRGKGNPESYHSCSHGAGRRMSRGQARKTFTLEDLAAQTQGVECRKDKEVLDEIPGAYKDIDQVMENQRDLVEVVHTLKQILNVKGA
jgi:tRNA-splicing ligase RtcB